jgi:hypothetical protein
MYLGHMNLYFLIIISLEGKNWNILNKKKSMSLVEIDHITCKNKYKDFILPFTAWQNCFKLNTVNIESSLRTTKQTNNN